MATKIKDNKIKPAYQSLEGQSLAGVLLGSLYLIKEILGNDISSKLPSPETLNKYADTVQDVVTSLHSTNNITDLAALTSTGKTGIIVFFMYKLYTRFLDARTDLKKEAMRLASEKDD